MGDLSSLTSTISIVLGVLTYFLTLVIDNSRTVLAKDVPAANQTSTMNELKSGLQTVLFSAALPLLLAFAMLFYLCLPTVASIQKNSKFQLWSFDLTTTLFVFLDLSIGACLVIAIIIAVLLLNKLWLCHTAE